MNNGFFKDKNKAHPWINQFDQVSPSLGEQGWHVRKDGGIFDAYAGATVTPRAVVKAVYKAKRFVEANRQALFTRKTTNVVVTFDICAAYVYATYCT